jgi:hypothetical protein
MRSRRLAALAVVLPLVVLGGCGDNPKPKPYDPPATSASPSPTTSTTPAAETPEAFIRRWVGVHNQMMSSGETSEFLALADHCEYCNKISKTVGDIYAGGGNVKTKGWSVTSVQKPMSLGHAAISIKFYVNSAPTSYTESANGPVNNLKGGTHLGKRAELRRVAGEWRVTFMVEVS